MVQSDLSSTVAEVVAQARIAELRSRHEMDVGFSPSVDPVLQTAVWLSTLLR